MHAAARSACWSGCARTQGHVVALLDTGTPVVACAGAVSWRAQEDVTDAPVANTTLPALSPEALRLRRSLRIKAIVLTAGCFSVYGAAMIVNSSSSDSIALYLFYAAVGRSCGALLLMALLMAARSLPSAIPLTRCARGRCLDVVFLVCAVCVSHVPLRSCGTGVALTGKPWFLCSADSRLRVCKKCAWRRYTLVPVLIAIVNVAGYYPLKYLTTYGGDVSIFVPITGLYIVFPPLFGEAGFDVGGACRCGRVAPAFCRGGSAPLPLRPRRLLSLLTTVHCVAVVTRRDRTATCVLEAVHGAHGNLLSFVRGCVTARRAITPVVATTWPRCRPDLQPREA